ncbi:helix-turn-helix transcriptional regulator [Marinobacter salinexigens]|uniref:Helix-turn-helix transcriptional regulator n=1 Tax=Marinobacter salinexigens TaxID=2919747 RepID=A0A5B0VPM3_9GAMM|nr:helix-turn-helix transcriptional regulator [Marinobacter salinexigens]KAA1176145.1 helix-turn-helix transcriptional regulator [Marinobacter salinexigens]
MGKGMLAGDAHKSARLPVVGNEVDSSISVEEFTGYNQLVSTLYRCLHTNDGFQPFFDEFCARFRALQGGILALTSAPLRMRYGWTFGYPEGFEQWFVNSDLPQQDAALLRFSSLPPRKFDSLAECDPEFDLRQILTDASLEWVEQIGLGDSAGMLISKDDDSRIVFLANRHRSEGPYSQKELLQMNMLAPHIENAVDLFHKLYHSRTSNETLTMALDRVNKPMVVFNEMARIVQCNAAAESILRSHPRLFVDDQEDSRLQSRDAGFNRKLNDAIITSIFNARDGVQDIITLFDEADDERIAICITPLAMGERENGEATGRYGALAEVIPFTVTAPPDIDKLCELFQCTRSEARIAGQLMQGASINEIAESEHLSVHTVRDYVKSLLSKNGYRRQAELVGALVRALG